MISTYFLIYVLTILQLNSNIVLSQRDFPNPAIINPDACSCDLRDNACDPNCCCDLDCDADDLSVSPICKSIRTTSDSSSEELSFQTWNCSNSTSAALYDYFPFVCVQFTLNEVINKSYSTDNVTFLRAPEEATNLRSTFITDYPELFQPLSLSSPITTNSYSINNPIKLSNGTEFTLPGNLAGMSCQIGVPVLFGVNRDVSCTSIDLCNYINNAASFAEGGGSSSSKTVMFFTKMYTPPSNTTINDNTEYYFKDSYFLNVSTIPFTTNDNIPDYCPGEYPLARTQRYNSACNSSDRSLCTSNSRYQRWSGCSVRDGLSYRTIPDSLFTREPTSMDDSTNFADFNNATNRSSISCSGTNIRRVFYRFNYSSIDNTISTVEVFALVNSSTTTTNVRITIVWNDVANNSASSTTIPRGYLVGEGLQFRRNGASSDISILVSTSSGLCIDATRQNLRYKKGTSSYCFIQLKQTSIQQCHDLKLSMYVYLNTYFAPASDVLSHPDSNATLIKIRDDDQDSLDLDRIDVTRSKNLLDTSNIPSTRSITTIYAKYDLIQNLPICYDVPSGIYIEFGFVRVDVSPTFSYERIISVQYNYTYSNWQFDCSRRSCNNTSTQRYIVSFQTAFVDYTNMALKFTDTTKSDITSADNYIQHLLWLITPEYKGEPAYRNYTIAMILIFIAISIVVMHVLLFGVMCPF